MNFENKIINAGEKKAPQAPILVKIILFERDLSKKKNFAKTFLNKQSTDPKGPESQEEIGDGS